MLTERQIKSQRKSNIPILLSLKNITVSDFIGERYDELRKDLEISDEDVQTLSLLKGYDLSQGKVLNKDILSYDGYMPLTKRAVAELEASGACTVYPSSNR